MKNRAYLRVRVAITGKIREKKKYDDRPIAVYRHFDVRVRVR